jgi:glycosyltransferase involved in cell wall biosynthesis
MLRHMERVNFAAADGRYFVSRAYQDEWRTISPLESHCLDPMWTFSPLPQFPYEPTRAAPALHFIGRTERCKGPHLFLQMAWWLPRSSHSWASIIGPDSNDGEGISSGTYLRDMAAQRRLDIRFEPACSRQELARLFATKSVVCLPSLSDTLNLVALEALFAGCPAVIGTRAGVCRYLEERFPNVPFVRFNVEKIYASMPAVERLLDNYDQHRDQLAKALQGVDLTPTGPGIQEIYEAGLTFDPAARAESDEWDRQLAAA